MKKIVLLGLVFFSVFASNIKAQTNNDGRNYVKLHIVQPLGDYKDSYKSGFGLDFGRMFPLNFDIADGMVLPGLDITFIDFTFDKGKDNVYYSDVYNISKINIGPAKTSGGVLMNLGVKLGPMVTVGITDGLVADFAIQYDPTIVFSVGRKGVNINEWNNGDCSQLDTKKASSISFAHRVGFKGDIRYSGFIFGLEFIVGGTTLNYSNKIIPVYNYSESQGVNDMRVKDEKDLGLGTLLLNIGYAF
ncbi:MAG: hypothetical protein J6P44_04340 [Bacteroidales bacterium]|nr:hypothetical protein [Bacteroidales bacterium]